MWSITVGSQVIGRAFVRPKSVLAATATAGKGFGARGIAKNLAFIGRPMSTATATKEETTDISAPGFSIKGNALAGRAAYLDFQATTPMDPRVLDAMLPYMTELYGNPHSRTHTYGWETEKAVEDARENVANLIGATSKEIIFTSGATESNNMAIKGVARFYGEHKKHLITTQTEHKCVLDSFRALQSEGFEVTYLPVQTNGLIDLDQLKAALRPETVLVSIMGVNNEIGVIQPLKEISKVSNAFSVHVPFTGGP
jgi:cysteine desulfurase